MKNYLLATLILGMVTMMNASSHGKSDSANTQRDSTASTPRR